VSGHGISAALYTGMVKSEMQSVFQDWQHPERLFARIHARLSVLAPNRYVTAILAILDLEAGVVRYVNAGHPSFLTRDGRGWDSTGPPLAMLGGAPRYEVREAPLPPGERLLLFGDGITEAMRSDGEEFGAERVRASYRATLERTPQDAVQALVESARAFAGGGPFHDDATALVVERVD